jgi:hypothetical protein
MWKYKISKKNFENLLEKEFLIWSLRFHNFPSIDYTIDSFLYNYMSEKSIKKISKNVLSSDKSINSNSFVLVPNSPSGKYILQVFHKLDTEIKELDGILCHVFKQGNFFYPVLLVNNKLIDYLQKNVDKSFLKYKKQLLIADDEELAEYSFDEKLSQKEKRIILQKFYREFARKCNINYNDLYFKSTLRPKSIKIYLFKGSSLKNFKIPPLKIIIKKPKKIIFILR